MGKWARGKTEPTDKLTLLSGSIASGESRTRLGWLPSALQHSILLILNPTLPSGPQDSPGQPPEASKRRSGRRSRQLTLSRRPGRRFLKRGPSVSSLEAGERAAGPALFLRCVLPALDQRLLLEQAEHLLLAAARAWSGSVVRVRVRVSGQGHGVRVRVKVRVRVRFRIGARAEVRSRDNLVDATLDVVQRAWLGRGLGVRLGFARNLCRVRALRAISGVV